MKKVLVALLGVFILVTIMSACSSDKENGSSKDASTSDTTTVADTSIQCKTLNQACTKTEDCCEGLECNQATKTCKRPVKKNGEFCASDDSCESGMCYGLTAKIKNSYCSKSCETDEDCKGFSGDRNYCCTYDSIDSTKKICIYTEGECGQRNGEAGQPCDKLGNVACKPGETYCVGERDDNGIYKAGSVCSKKCEKSADCANFFNMVGGYKMNCYECLNSAQYGTAMCIKTDRCVSYCNDDRDCIYPQETHCASSPTHGGNICQGCYLKDDTECTSNSDCIGGMSCTLFKIFDKKNKVVVERKYCASCSPNRFRPDCYGDLTCEGDKKCQMTFTLDKTGQAILGLNTSCAATCELSKLGKRAGEDCTDDLDCCSLFCLEGKCANFCHPACKILNEECRTDGECCSLRCGKANPNDEKTVCLNNINCSNENCACNYGNGFKGVCRELGMSLDEAGCTIVNMGICLPTVYQGGEKPTKCEKASDCKVPGEICKLLFGNEENDDPLNSNTYEDNTTSICAKEYAGASKPGQQCKASFSCSTNLCLRVGYCSGTCDNVGTNCDYGNAGNYTWKCMPQPLSEGYETVNQTNLCIPISGSGKECSGDKDCSNGEVCKMFGFDAKGGKVYSYCSAPTQGGSGFNGECKVCSSDEACYEGCVEKPCETDLCLNNGRCSSLCKTNTDCPSGYACYESWLGLGQLYQGICIPMTELLCSPCFEDAYCNSGNENYNNPNPPNRCVAVPDGSEDKYCLASCNPQDPNACPTGFTCKDVKGVNLCFPSNNSCIE
ncbi:MAG: hypothetical protein N2746_00925 [Deltaproteobacteria bacterium]|nr:hypothetical protein [Deltaproteobacteria bacterium]